MPPKASKVHSWVLHDSRPYPTRGKWPGKWPTDEFNVEKEMRKNLFGSVQLVKAQFPNW